MTRYELYKLLHVFLFGMWLGSDFATFATSRFVLKKSLDLKTRATLARVMLLLDMGPRIALILIIPAGFGLAGQMGVSPVNGGWLTLIWIGALFWVATIITIFLNEEKSWGEVVRRVDLGWRVVLATVIGGYAIASLAGDGPFATSWLPIKLLLISAIIASGIAIRFALKPFTAAFTRLMSEGSNNETETALRRSLLGTYPFVFLIWASVIAAAAIGIAKP